MEKDCVVFGCRNSTTSLEEKKTGCDFFAFPLNQNVLVSKWLRKLNLEGWTPGPENVICEEHFSVDSFEILDNKRILKPDAIPNLVDEWDQIIIKSEDPFDKEYIERWDETDLADKNELRCRICAKFLSPKNAVDIYSKDENVIEKIMACIPILMKMEDNLPKHICRLCLSDLNTSYRMLIRAIESEKLFHCLLNKMQEDSDSEETPDKIDVKQEIPEAPTICVLCNIRFEDITDLSAHFREKHVHEFDFTDQNADKGDVDVVNELQDNLFYLMDAKNDVEIKQITEAEYDEKELKLNYEIESAERVSDAQQNHCESIKTEEPLQLHLQGFPKSIDRAGTDTSLRTESNEPVRSNDAHAQYVPCQYCAKAFESEDALNEHMENHVESATCELCGFRCADYKKMLKHRDEHTNHSTGKTNTCQICFTVFPTHTEMMQHYKGVHRLKEVKDNVVLQKWICRYCGKEIGTKLSLAIHERVHTGARPFVCERCGRSFKSKANLIQHQPVHTGVKRYKCSICNKAFARKAFVDTHMRVHTGERPYPCDVCGNRYTQIGDMRRHMKRHYAVVPDSRRTLRGGGGGAGKGKEVESDNDECYDGRELISITRAGDDGRVLSIRRSMHTGDGQPALTNGDLGPSMGRLRSIESKKAFEAAFGDDETVAFSSSAGKLAASAEESTAMTFQNSGMIKLRFAKDVSDFRRILVELQQ